MSVDVDISGDLGKYEIDWRNVRTFHDMKRVLRLAVPYVYCDRGEALVLKSRVLIK